jgi:vitamin B12/bleomycin/antimicrobial peptide transport system ATP-binding/permease protein
MSKVQVLRQFTSMRLFFQTLWQLVIPYWKSSERWGACLLLAVTVGLNLGMVYINVLLNQWYTDFYNSLQAVDKNAFVQALIRFSYLAGIFIVIAVYQTYLNQMLQIKWRRWLTAQYLTDWLGWQNYYRMQLFGSKTDNPDQRISEDIDQFIQLTLSLSLGLLSAVVTLFSFLTILWRLSGVLAFEVHGMAIVIPGYMVWVALVYSLIGTWIIMKIGRPLIRLNFDQQRYEAKFRFSMVRLRENSESIAFYKGEAQEHANFLERFTSVVGNSWQIMKRQKLLNWFTSGYGQIASIFPYLVVAPRFFARKIQLGGLIQTATAFGSVQGALSYIINAYTDIATWKAVIERLQGFNNSIKQTKDSHVPGDGFKRHMVTEKIIKADKITIKLPDGRTLLEHIDLNIKPSDSLLITGASGAGKSTLLRTLAGLWPFVEGQLTMPTSATMMFLPQKPYLPLGTLRQVLCYPNPPDAEDEKLRDALSVCQLDKLADDLDKTKQWSHILSIGEQQRIAFARSILVKPEFIFMDEATSALDETSEAQLYEMLKSRLPDAAIISVGHRKSLRAWHKTERAL